MAAGQAPGLEAVAAEQGPEDDQLEASQVREAALDDKLGVELRSIVEQIQVGRGLRGVTWLSQY